MNFNFWKMQGCGNDFLIMDYVGDSDPPRFSTSEIVYFCDRHYGIGADGLVLLKPSLMGHTAAWTFYNCDGSEAEMCGNAARCVIKFLTEKFEKDKEEGDRLVEIETSVGVIKGRVNEDGLVEVALFPKSENSQLEYEEITLRVEGEAYRICFINTGVPHAVIEVAKLKGFPVAKIGRALVKHQAFGPAGTNVTFYQQDLGQKIFATTFERGVEKETLACGTGAVAASVVYAQMYLQSLPIEVTVPGGTLIVDSSPVSRTLLLKGNADNVMQVELTEVPKGFQPASFFGAGS